MKDILQKKQKRKLNKKFIIILILLIIIIAIAIVTFVRYKTDNEVRNWIDKNILKKEVFQENAVYVELENSNAQSCVYSQYLGVLSNNKFDIYDVGGNKEATLDMEISNPIFYSNNRFLAVAENGGQKVYLVTNKNIEWETKVEGNISQIYVNKNGYVAVVVSDTSHKTVIEMYSSEGESLFKTFLSSTRAADVSISKDNKYLAIAEVDTSGTVIQSTVKIISIAKSQEDPTNYVENTYKAEANRLITNVSYQDKNNLLCRYTDGISIIADNKEEFINQDSKNKISFSSIDMENGCVTLEEKSSGLFSVESILKIINSNDRKETEYSIGEIAKNLYVKENSIALNLGTEIEFINKDGWLMKKYIANQEISNVILSSELAGIVYRNKIEIIDL